MSNDRYHLEQLVKYKADFRKLIRAYREAQQYLEESEHLEKPVDDYRPAVAMATKKIKDLQSRFHSLNLQPMVHGDYSWDGKVFRYQGKPILEAKGNKRLELYMELTKYLI